MAAHYGHIGVVKLLLEREDVDLDWPDKRWLQTPLFRAAKEGHQSVVEELLRPELEDRISLDSRDKDDQTGLAIAAERGYVQIIRLLLRAGADASLVDSKGRTAMSRAEKAGQTEVCQLRLC
ncbi:ankyrin [Parathielavia hyrcaniae]|uniref:Ankyrin n=1 Tax=Parathielavia hyrcaniae TaxID=113614 RepID=A0AAN6Q2H8_9PEZI|nr:ankyrin [Parathielavia hyrcaniae]